MLSELWHSSSAHCFALINVIQTCIEFGFTKCIHFTHIAPSNMNYLRCKIRQIHLHLSQKKIHILSAYFDKLCDSFWQLTMAYRSPPILSQPLAAQFIFLHFIHNVDSTLSPIFAGAVAAIVSCVAIRRYFLFHSVELLNHRKTCPLSIAGTFPSLWYFVIFTFNYK